MAHPRARADELKVEDRRRQVAALLLGGMRNQTRIADQLGVSKATISRDVKHLEAEWKRTALQDITSAKGLELERIERLIQALWPAALRGEGTREVLALMQHKAKLLGLNAPERREDKVTLEIKQLIDQVADEDDLSEDERQELFESVQRYLKASA